MAVTDYSFLEIDTDTDNDIPLKGHYSHSLAVEPVSAPSPGAADTVLGLSRYTEEWTFPEPGQAGIELTKAEYDSLCSTARTAVSKADDYPRLNVLTGVGSPNTWTQYPVLVSAVRDLAGKGDGIKRYVTVTFTRRSTSGSLTFVVDSGGSNEATVDLVDLESVRQTVGFIEAGTVDGDGAPVLTGPAAVRATVAGYVATGDLDKLQKVLDARTAVEMVGACFDTTGGGYLATELPSGSEAFLTDLSVLRRAGSLALVQLVIVHDRT